MNPRNAMWDIPGAAIAALLIAADVALHMTGHEAVVFDNTVPVIAALYLGGRLSTNSAAAANGKTTTATSEDGKTTITTGHA